MTESGRPLTVLAIATYLKGEEFLRECRRQGCRVLLLTADSLVDAAWPRESIDAVHTVRRDSPADALRRRDRRPRAHRAHRPHRRARRLRRRDRRHAARVPADAGDGRDDRAPFPRQARHARPRPERRHPRARLRGARQRRRDQGLDGGRAAALGDEAAVVGGGDRHQEDRRRGGALAGARSGR